MLTATSWQHLLEEARLKLVSSQRLFEASCHGDAYYLGGYAIELALKAGIAIRHYGGWWPEREQARRHYSHDLGFLVREAGLHQALTARIRHDAVFEGKWKTITEWRESSRYFARLVSREQAGQLIYAIGHHDTGVLQWVSGILIRR
jgi:hypothetical protein